MSELEINYLPLNLFIFILKITEILFGNSHSRQLHPKNNK